MMNYYCPTCRSEKFSRESVTRCEACGDGAIELAHISNVKSSVVPAAPVVDAQQNSVHELSSCLTADELEAVRRLVDEKFQQVMFYAAKNACHAIEGPAAQQHAERLHTVLVKLRSEKERAEQEARRKYWSENKTA